MRTDGRKVKVGLFGGTFEPFHLGHLNSVLSVANKYELDEVKILPASRSPLRAQIQGSSDVHRLAMIEAAIEGHGNLVKVDTRELKRGGVSYTRDTIEELLKESRQARLFLIVGADQFAVFDQWKDFDYILRHVDLIVTSRPGSEFPNAVAEWPEELQRLVVDFDARQAMLKEGHSIHIFQLEDRPISGAEVRRRVSKGQSIQSMVADGVQTYIEENDLYRTTQRHIGDFEKFTQACSRVLADKGGINVQSYDLRDRQAPSEFTLICSGTSTRHTSALADHLVREVKKDYNVWPESLEGQSEGRWVVIDYGSLIVHVFYDFVRQEYRLEDLWSKRTK